SQSAEPAQHVTFEILFVDFPAGIGAVEELLALRIRRRDADRPRRADIADNTNGVEVGIEHLNALVAPVSDVDVALGVRGNSMGRVELARPRSAGANRLYKVAVLGKFRHA